MLLRCVLWTYKILHYTETSGGDTDEVDFAEQPSIRQPSTAQPFKCKIVVDHMLLVCEEVLPDGE